MRLNTKWQPSRHGWYKLNIDGVASGGVLRSHLDNLVVAYTNNINGCTSNQAEGMVLS